MKVKMKKLHPDAVKPKYAKESDAGMDLVVLRYNPQNLQKQQLLWL